MNLNHWAGEAKVMGV